MVQAVTATIPLQDLTPPRMLEEFSGRIGELGPPPRMLDEFAGQIGRLAPGMTFVLTLGGIFLGAASSLPA